jgi:CoA:oxalate CoA-transferase
MNGPFKGLKVIEFGRFIAAPYCCQLLADGGADVIKVEPLTGDDTRHHGEIVPGEGRQFLNKNRGKRSLAVDLNHPVALAAVRHLCESADIIVANFRPGQAEKLGLAYEQILEANPNLIYAENTAYGRKGPMAGKPGMDVVLAAYSGMLNITADGPLQNPQPIIDYTAGLLLAWGVSTALYTRQRTGKGQRLDVALLHAALVLQNNGVNHVDAIDGWREEYVEYLKTAFQDGATWADVLERHESLQPHAPSRAYYGFLRTADGMIAVAALPQTLRKRFMDVVGFDDRLSREPGWLPEDARAYADELVATVEGELGQHPSAYWLEKLAAVGIPAGPVRVREQLIDDEQVVSNGFLTRLEHELVGGITVVAPPVAFSGTPLVAERASPLLGQHSVEVLRESGLAEAEINELVERRAVTVA